MHSDSDSEQYQVRCSRRFSQRYAWCSGWKVSPAPHHEALALEVLDAIADILGAKRPMRIGAKQVAGSHSIW